MMAMKMTAMKKMTTMKTTTTTTMMMMMMITTTTETRKAGQTAGWNLVILSRSGVKLSF